MRADDKDIAVSAAQKDVDTLKNFTLGSVFAHEYGIKVKSVLCTVCYVSVQFMAFKNMQEARHAVYIRTYNVKYECTSQFEILQCIKDHDAIDSLAGVVHFLLQTNVEFTNVIHWLLGFPVDYAHDCKGDNKEASSRQANHL